MNIWVYIIRRTLYVVPILLGVCGIIFVLFNLVGGDPAITMLGKHATQSQILELRAELGLNKSLFMQYLDIVESAFTLDFGRSWNTRQEIWHMIKQGAIPSLSFTLPSFFITFILSVSISLIVAYFRGGKLDRFMVVGTVALMSVSQLVIILFFQRYLAAEFGLFEISGYDFSDPMPYISLPIIIAVVVSIGPDVRYFRTIVLDEIYQDYVRTARAKGLSDRKILLKHVFKNIGGPLITYTVIKLPFLILGALLIESFFGIPGLGGITLDALNNSDFPVLKSISILSAVAYIFFNLLTDILYPLVDPRVKLG